MAGKGANRSRSLVFAALIAGFLAGCLFVVRDDRPEFLKRFSPFAQKEESATVGRDVVSYYAVPESWDKQIAKLRKEFPNAIEHDAFVGGTQGKVFVVPRVENGHVQLFYPPEQEITILPRRLALDEKGRVVAISDQPAKWTGVQLRVYHQPRPLDSLVEWVGTHLRV